MAPRLVLVDANILLLWIVGNVDRRLIGRGKTNAFSAEDFLILQEYLGRFDGVSATPHVIAETDNLLDLSLYGKRLHVARRFLEHELQVWTEHYVESSRASRSEVFEKLGLTDATIFSASGNVAEVLTGDLPLYNWLLSRGAKAVNFTHLRTGAWTDW